MYIKTDIPGLYKDHFGLLYLLDDFGFARRLDLDVAHRYMQRYIDALAALSGRSY